MPGLAPPEAAQAEAAVAALQATLGDTLRAVYLHGSAAAGALRPQSDLDLLAVLGRPMTDAERHSLLVALLRLSARHPIPPGGPRCLELLAFTLSDLASPVPDRADFVYGEWLRTGFEAGTAPLPERNPEYTLLLAQARREGRPLVGPPAADLLPAVPPQAVRAAMRDALPALLAWLQGDERNVLLTLARMWRTAATGDFVSKDAAAAWALPRLDTPDAPLLDLARRAYLGAAADDWTARRPEARRLALHLGDRVTALV